MSSTRQTKSQNEKEKEKLVTFMPKEIKIPKPPKQPDKPLFPYMRYSRRVWEKVKAQHPEMKMWDIGKVVGEQWRKLTEEERQAYNDEYEVEKAEYSEAMKAYHNSTAYREWLKAKEKAQSAIQEQQMMEKMIGSSVPKEEPRFQLQQIDEEDEEDAFSAKNVAASRFQRNHRLINEIFSDTAVPDVKTLVTKPRLENLKRQVQSLMQHQRKLESEILDMEEKFEAKKRRILERSELFEQEMDRLSKPSISKLEVVSGGPDAPPDQAPGHADETAPTVWLHADEHWAPSNAKSGEGDAAQISARTLTDRDDAVAFDDAGYEKVSGIPDTPAVPPRSEEPRKHESSHLSVIHANPVRMPVIHSLHGSLHGAAAGESASEARERSASEARERSPDLSIAGRSSGLPSLQRDVASSATAPLPCALPPVQPPMLTSSDALAAKPSTAGVLMTTAADSSAKQATPWFPASQSL